MPTIDRPHKINIRLSDDEKNLKEVLEEHLGTDGSSVFRQALLDFGRSKGYEFPLTKKKRPSSKA